MSEEMSEEMNIVHKNIVFLTNQGDLNKCLNMAKVLDMDRIIFIIKDRDTHTRRNLRADRENQEKRKSSPN